MNNIIHTIRHAARTAAVLLIALLAAQTAGAQGDIPEVSDADGLAWAFNVQGVSVVNVRDDITGVGDLPSLHHNLTINLNGHTISGDELHIEVYPDGSLTINGGGQDGSVGNIISGYADGPAINSEGTVTLSHVNITTNSDHAIVGGGTLYIGNNVSFNGWTERPFITEDVNIIEDGNYSGTVVATVTVGGVTHYFENIDAALTYIVSHPDNDDFSLSGTTYTIKSATGWDFFCYLQEGGETFSGKTVVLAGDIGTPEDPVTRMGSNTTQFRGTFDGQGHTLTVQYGTPSEPVNQQFVAPFPKVAGGATFRSLTIAGSIYSDYDTSGDKGTGGLIGCLFGGVTVEHCVSTVTVNAASDRAGGFVGDCEHAVTFTDCVSSAIVTCTGSGSGFVGWSRNGEHTIAFSGCLFDGKVLKQGNVGSGNGSFVGWKGFSKTVTITNCIAAPAADENMATDNSATFCRYSADTTLDNGETHITNCYYTQTLGTAQGKARHTVTAGTDVTVAHAGVATHYATSGITAYKATGASTDSDPFIAGLLYNNNVVDVLYAGSGDVVSLTLSNTATGAPDGYQYGYTASAGTLDGSTLTMPDEDVTVSVNTAALRSTGEPVEVSYVDAGGNTQTAQAIALDGTETGLGRSREETWYFVGLPTVAFDHRLNLMYDINLILADGCTMNVTNTNTNTNSCILVGNNLHIYGQAEGTGILNAQNQVDILSSDVIFIQEGTLGIHGGNVIATNNCTAKDANAIIGQNTGQYTAGDVLVIDGGTLTANGNDGYGIFIEGGDTRINGGQVTATGGNSGIAVSSRAAFLLPKIPGTLTLSGGTLTASSIKTFSGMDREGTIAVANGYTYTDGSNIYDSATASATLAALTDVTLQPGLAANQAPDGNYWTTYYNGATGFTIDEDEHACAYTAKYSGSQLTLHKLGKQIPKNTAVIIVADNDEVSMTAATDLPAFSGANDLRGVDYDTPVASITSALGTGTFYVLGMTTVGGDQHFGFHRYTGSTMAAHKAFVHVAGSQSAARSLTMVFDEASGIESAEANSSLFTLHSSLSEWFTLDGRRLQAKPTAPGIYINNGKKVVIK